MAWRSSSFRIVILAFGVFVALVGGMFWAVGGAWNAAVRANATSFELRVTGSSTRTVDLHHATCVLRADGRIVVRNDPTSRIPAQIVADRQNGRFSTSISTGDGGMFISTAPFVLDGANVRFVATGGSFTDPRLSGERVEAQVAGSIPCTTDASGD
ncbi:hypothetical protein [Leifsonia shinshuensis]|uniref:Uncharacterized protein n=1 Tax=Leifsonia shinshuensis TaxID=150026 RepID=A0A7G6YF84_9MICO|nr:hypothetical protein [Leifsonia shinshuensis]QNE37149.1 hypothetical protein F1C12_19880 [Leifsonia shinshuensis]